ncbi:MAG: hypothetical protein V1837_00215 [Candidatus Woesearchaeota archaeon]
MGKCPQCLGDNTKFVQYMGINCLVCNDCGYSEIENLEVYPEDRGSQKAKARYSSYKAGGPRRTVQH